MTRDPQTKLLESLVVDNADLEALENKLAEFNVFEAIGAVRQEERHSDFLRFLFDPSENHGLRDWFLKTFLKRALAERGSKGVGVVDIDASDLSDSIVERERMWVDVLVHSPSEKIVLAIENKVDSSEHSNQLQRYKESVEKEFPGYRRVLVFLTPDGEEPTDPDWLAVSYSTIVSVLTAIQNSRANSLGNDVAVSLKHYATMLRRHVLTESEITALCQKLYRAHRKAFDLIFEHREDHQSELAKEVHELLNRQPLLGMDQSTKYSIKFFAKSWDEDPRQKKGGTWTKNGRVLLFEVLNSPQKTLRFKLVIGPGEAAFRKSLFDCAKANKEAFPGCTSELYEKWTTIYSRSVLVAKDYEGELEELLERLREKLGKLLESDVPRILKALSSVVPG